MRNLSEMQWWVIWIAIGVVLFIWWDGLFLAIQTRAENSPDYIRTQQEAAPDYESGRMDVRTYSSTIDLALKSAYREAESQERTKRLIPTVVVFAGFAVWVLQPPKRSIALRVAFAMALASVVMLNDFLDARSAADSAQRAMESDQRRYQSDIAAGRFAFLRKDTDGSVERLRTESYQLFAGAAVLGTAAAGLWTWARRFDF